MTTNAQHHTNCNCNHEHEHNHHSCGCDHEHQHHSCNCDHEHQHHSCGCNHDHGSCSSKTESAEHEHHHHGCGCGHEHQDLSKYATKLNFGHLAYSGDDELVTELILALNRLRKEQDQEVNLLFKSKQSAVEELRQLFDQRFADHPFFTVNMVLGLIYTWALDPTLSSSEFEKYVKFMAEGDTNAQLEGLDNQFLLTCEKLRTSFLQDLMDIDNFRISNLFTTFLNHNNEQASDPFNLLVMIKDFTLAVATMGSYLVQNNANNLTSEEKLESQALLQSLFNLATIIEQSSQILMIQLMAYPEDSDNLLSLNFNLANLFDDTSAFIVLNAVLTYECFVKGLAYPADTYDLTNAFLISL
ncbi:hypothetical protein [Psittacicella gerlachiana]|uniref:Uncharacterized protein n=1 Tax=Psittacicella gerlachiana TaxID=2028574 RepID=A0A3A1YG06_9GAMM|nr:hypothetical protein [Psittacicella gerlachiana]RIY36020.1 hypothetical protein CKF59_03090 [Psittacicella gerlachiana]